jgi:hypothetical protein
LLQMQITTAAATSMAKRLLGAKFGSIFRISINFFLAQLYQLST